MSQSLVEAMSQALSVRGDELREALLARWLATATEARVTPVSAESAKPWWQQTRQVLLATSAGLLLLGLLGEWTGLVERLGWAWLPQVLFATAVLTDAYAPSRSALASLRRRRLTISSLLVAGSLGAIGLGLWEEAASLVVIFSLGGVLEAYAADRARRTLKALMDLAPPEAIRLAGGAEQTLPVEEIRAGDLIRVKPGSRVPLDGVVLDGTSAVDQSAITGNLCPRTKQRAMRSSPAR